MKERKKLNGIKVRNALNKHDECKQSISNSKFNEKKKTY